MAFCGSDILFMPHNAIAQLQAHPTNAAAQPPRTTAAIAKRSVRYAAGATMIALPHGRGRPSVVPHHRGTAQCLRCTTTISVRSAEPRPNHAR